MKLKEHVVYENGRHIATVTPASDAAVMRVMRASEHSPDGRSNPVWVRLENGDLLLGVYPQGDTCTEVADSERV